MEFVLYIIMETWVQLISMGTFFKLKWALHDDDFTHEDQFTHYGSLVVVLSKV